MRRSNRRGHDLFDQIGGGVGAGFEGEKPTIERAVGGGVAGRHRFAESGAVTAEAKDVKGFEPFGAVEIGEDEHDEPVVFVFPPFREVLLSDELGKGTEDTIFHMMMC